MDDPHRKAPDDIEYAYTVAPTEAIRIMIEDGFSGTIRIIKSTSGALRRIFIQSAKWTFKKGWFCLGISTKFVFSSIVSPITFCYNLLLAVSYASAKRRFSLNDDMKTSCKNTADDHEDAAFLSFIRLVCLILVVSAGLGAYHQIEKDRARAAYFEAEPIELVINHPGCERDGAESNTFYCSTHKFRHPGWYTEDQLEDLSKYD